MAEKNGGDIGAVYQAVQSLAGDMRAGFSEVRREFAEVRQEFVAVRQEMQVGFAAIRQEISEARQTVTDYHSAVLGHGMLISDLEARVRRLERHAGLTPEG